MISKTPAPFTFPEALTRVKDGESTQSVACELLNSLTSDEKLWLLYGDTPFWPGFHEILSIGYIHTEPLVFGEVQRLGIPGIRFTDGPRGINMGHSTVFPVSMARGATWDVSLEERVGHAMGLEGRAQGANSYGGVCINLPRHPAWGRAQETYGEDPILLGEFGAALTRGIKRNLIAIVKHYALNSMENARFQVDVRIDEAVLLETYLPHFRRVIEEGALGVMSSYNSVNGEWAGQNGRLLTGILRELWGFDGFVMTDFLFGHRDPCLSLKAGQDIEAPFAQQRSDPTRGLKAGLERGYIEWAHVDRAGERTLNSLLVHYSTRDREDPSRDFIFAQEHQDLAREVAASSMVLLKNEQVNGKQLLPLSIQDVKNLAVIGRLASQENTGDMGSSIVRCSKVVSPYEGLETAFSGSKIELSDSDDIQQARKIAANADVAIVIVGYTAADEGEYVFPATSLNPALKDLYPPPDDSEGYKAMAPKLDNLQSMLKAQKEKGGDRTSVRLREADVDLINATYAANNRTVVCIVTAGAVIMEEWQHKIPGILISWYSGTQGGNALADVMTGRVDASGRLPYSIPKTEEDLPFFDINATSIEYDSWFGQRLLDHKGVKAAYPLGYGLSYTKFELSDLTVGIPNGEKLKVGIRLRNIGERDGRHVIQIYGKSEDEPEITKVLLGFLPVRVPVGGSKTVSLDVSLRPLQKWREGQMILPKRMRLEAASFCGDSSAIGSGCILV